MSRLVYLDYNCFQRGFDDQDQTRIRLESAACERIFADAERGAVSLIWSFMHEDENRLCPFVDRKEEIRRLSSVCAARIGPDEEIRALAKELEKKTGLGAKDALHLAAAKHGGAERFVTCDDNILSKKVKIPIDIQIMNPVDYIFETERRGKDAKDHAEQE
jgi:hypothetical protein